MVALVPDLLGDMRWLCHTDCLILPQTELAPGDLVTSAERLREPPPLAGNRLVDHPIGRLFRLFFALNLPKLGCGMLEFLVPSISATSGRSLLNLYGKGSGDGVILGVDFS